MNDRNILIAVVIGGLLYVGGQYISSQPQRIQKETEAAREITVQGHGIVKTKPNIAYITLGVTTGRQATAVVATNLLTQKFNAVLSTIKQQGVKDGDINTTNLSINPVYDWGNGKQTLLGFEARENVEVKIRDLSKIGEILAKSTIEGVNQAGNIEFRVDDPEKLQVEAQKDAIENAQEKAKELAKTLGVGLGKVKSFNTTSGGYQPTPLYRNMALNDAVGSGEAAPEVAVGTQDITSDVTIVYELK